MARAHHKRVKIGEYAMAMDDILEEMKGATSEGVREAADATAKEVQKLTKQQAASRLGGTGKYARGWSVRKWADTYAHHRRTVYQSKLPGLPHLLEHGHGGPRPAGPHPHIVTDEETEKIFTENMKKAMEDG
jgi:hypothetical protein